jgi:alpha-ribazole phosphatase
MAQIYLVRHTKVDVPSGICYGSSDVPLAPSFLIEAKKVSEQIQGIPFDTVYSSPLSRCTQLANILSPEEYITDPRLVELNFGAWEGQPWDNIFQHPFGKEWMDNYLELPCPGGESYHDLHHRVTSFISALDHNKNTLIISHAGVIMVFLSICKKIPLRELFDLKVTYGSVWQISSNLDCGLNKANL